MFMQCVSRFCPFGLLSCAGANQRVTVRTSLFPHTGPSPIKQTHRLSQDVNAVLYEPTVVSALAYCTRMHLVPLPACMLYGLRPACLVSAFLLTSCISVSHDMSLLYTQGCCLSPHKTHSSPQ